jgi:uncharacterized protein RhaS with RHS repeats
VSQDGSVPSRTIPPGNPGYYEWQFERNDPHGCNCGLITKIIEPDGGTYELQYDAKYNLTKRIKISNDGQSSLVWEWVYDPVTHKVSSYTPPESVSGSSVVLYMRAADTDPGNVGGEVLTKAILPMHWRVPYNLSSIWVMRRDSKGRLLEMTGPSANAVGDNLDKLHYDYDKNHNLIRITDADGYVSETTFDERDLQWKVRVGVGTSELGACVTG